MEPALRIQSQSPTFHDVPRDAARPVPPKQFGPTRCAGIERVARLDGNVGYIDIRAFQHPARFVAVMDAVIEGLADADALVIDLRRHWGGSRAGAALLASYLFDTEPAHVDAAYWAPRSRARPMRIVPRATVARFTERPVSILVGPGTSAVAADLARSLERLGRARVVVQDGAE
ncbi:MAG TPA: S41 family peptidase [Gemmatimonadaceae bacterium]|nr:S41 family peptidase [Gemmatimonadaceae bacterium]